MIQKKFRKLLLIAATCTACIPMAFSQIKDVKKSQKREAEYISKKREMPQKNAEAMAQKIFEDDIHAERLTPDQASKYYQCVQEDYATNFTKTPEAKKYRNNLKRMENYNNMNTNEQKKFHAKMEKSIKEMEKLQDRSENYCMKKLGLKVTRGKVFGRIRQPDRS